MLVVQRGMILVVFPWYVHRLKRLSLVGGGVFQKEFRMAARLLPFLQLGLYDRYLLEIFSAQRKV